MPSTAITTWKGSTALYMPCHKTLRDVLDSSLSTAGPHTQSHLLAVLKRVFKSLHWELCFPLSTLIWLHRPSTRFASWANGREELNRPLSSCSHSLTNTPLTHTHISQQHPCPKKHQEKCNLDFQHFLL